MGLALAALGVLAPPSHAAPRPSRSVLAQCATHRPALQGWKALRAGCPGIDSALTRLHLRALLPPHWRQSLSSRALAGLAALTHRYAATPRSAFPDPAALRKAARALAPPAPAPSLWARLRAWFHRWTAPLVAQLRHWLRSLAHGHRRSRVLRAMLWILGSLLSVIVLLAIYLGLRAGAFRRHSRRISHPGQHHDAHGPPAAQGSEPDWSALAEQPSRLLQLLIEVLVGARRLEGDRPLTCRELTARARFDTSAQREEFRRIALLAERQRYGPPGAIRIPDSVLRNAKALHAQCLAPPQDVAQEAR